MDKYECLPRDAAKIKDWIATRGGILIWKSINLGNPGGSWTTPALTDGQPTPKPTWQAANEPSRCITDLADVVVTVPRLVKRFHVGVRRGSGLSFVVTDGGTRRIRREVEKANEALYKAGKPEGAWHEFDYSEQAALIFVPDRVVPLAEWEAP